ncbi:hypothetical protein H920_09932 [Fukomys damarensis]|uniref:Uncharacterized protein n=1 Tax=Fukomys damarensis TaxID=885580 RepID=A0A091D985_FUKDA|nr:hypothetical protein H920_09932 [Fukomys damarensis]
MILKTGTPTDRLALEYMDEGIRIGEIDELSEFIEEVGYFQFCVEGQLQQHQCVDQGIHSPKEHRSQNQLDTEEAVHDDRVPQRVTNGPRVVISHHNNGKTFQDSTNQDKLYLTEAFCISDALILCLAVPQHQCNGMNVVLKENHS